MHISYVSYVCVFVYVCTCACLCVCMCVHSGCVWYSLVPSAFQVLCVTTSRPPQEGGLVRTPHPISDNLGEASDRRAEPGRAAAGLRSAGPAGSGCFGDGQVALLAGRGGGPEEAGAEGSVPEHLARGSTGPAGRCPGSRLCLSSL